MKNRELNESNIYYELKPNFGKLKRGKYLGYIIFFAFLVLIVFLNYVLSNDSIFAALFYAFISVVVLFANVYSSMSTMSFFHYRKTRLYKKYIVLPILKKIDGFVKYIFKSREYRIQSLSFDSKDKIEDLMVFRRNNYTLYCSEFLCPTKIDKNKKHLKMLLMKFVLDKPLGEQMVISFHNEPNASAYFKYQHKHLRKQWYNIYSLFEIFTFNNDKSIKLHKQLMSLIKILGENPRIVIDNDVICIYKQLDKDNFELIIDDEVKDQIISQSIYSDCDLLEKILATANLMDTYTENDSSIIMSIPPDEKEVEENLSSYIKSYTKNSYYVSRIIIPLLFILLPVIALYIAALLVPFIGIAPLFFWLAGVILLFTALRKSMSRLVNNIVAKRLIKKICYRFNHSLYEFKYRRRIKRTDTDKRPFRYFDYDYLRQHSIECHLGNYKLYLFGDDCFNGTLMEFEYNTQVSAVVQLLVHKCEIKIVEGYDNYVIDPALQKCILIVSDYLQVFNPYLTLNIVLRPTLVQIYVPSSGYIDLSMGLFEAPDYELTAQNAVQISRMIRAADKFVETHISNYLS